MEGCWSPFLLSPSSMNSNHLLFSHIYLLFFFSWKFPNETRINSDSGAVFPFPPNGLNSFLINVCLDEGKVVGEVHILIPWKEEIPTILNINYVYILFPIHFLFLSFYHHLLHFHVSLFSFRTFFSIFHLLFILIIPYVLEICNCNYVFFYELNCVTSTSLFSTIQSFR